MQSGNHHIKKGRPCLTENEREAFKQIEKEMEHQKQMIDSMSAGPNAIT